MNKQTTLSNNELILALKQQKQEQCAIFCARLNKAASIIREKQLNAAQASELLDSEVEHIQSQQRGDNQ